MPAFMSTAHMVQPKAVFERAQRAPPPPLQEESGHS
jgi:hypothetical protein